MIDQSLVFFGGFAIYSYGKYLSKKDRYLLLKYPDFDVLAIDPLKAANNIKHDLKKHKINNIEINKKAGIGEIIAPHMKLK